MNKKKWFKKYWWIGLIVIIIILFFGTRVLYKQATQKCEYPLPKSGSCDVGSYDPSTGNCEYRISKNRFCDVLPIGEYNSITGKCEYDRTYNCEEGYKSDKERFCEDYPNDINFCKCIKFESGICLKAIPKENN